MTGKKTDADQTEGDAPAAGVSPEPEAAGGGRETGGQKGPEPTRYGDWEKNGICSDF